MSKLKIARVIEEAAMVHNPDRVFQHVAVVAPHWSGEGSLEIYAIIEKDGELSEDMLYATQHLSDWAFRMLIDQLKPGDKFTTGHHLSYVQTRVVSNAVAAEISRLTANIKDRTARLDAFRDQRAKTDIVTQVSIQL